MAVEVTVKLTAEIMNLHSISERLIALEGHTVSLSELFKYFEWSAIAFALANALVDEEVASWDERLQLSIHKMPSDGVQFMVEGDHVRCCHD